MGVHSKGRNFGLGELSILGRERRNCRPEGSSHPVSGTRDKRL